MQIQDRAEYGSKPKPLTGTADQTVLEAAKLMSAKDYGSIIITNGDGTVAGMLTERDLMKRVIANGLDPATTPVGDVMTKDVRTARADDDLLNWLRIMSNERFRRLPIVDGDGRLQNVMTQGDFVSYTWPQLLSRAGELARASFGENMSVPMILVGIAVYTIAIMLAAAFLAG